MSVVHDASDVNRIGFDRLCDNITQHAAGMRGLSWPDRKDVPVVWSPGLGDTMLRSKFSGAMSGSAPCARRLVSHWQALLLRENEKQQESERVECLEHRRNRHHVVLLLCRYTAGLMSW